MNRILIDTHVFLWFIADHPRLSRSHRSLIGDPTSDVSISLASLWEISIKYSLGKLDLPRPPSQFLPDQLDLNALRIEALAPEHVYRVAELPFVHRDPFDRLIAAQCLEEDLPLLSVDPIFDAYGVRRIG